jgi:hypothetical protein
MSRVTKAELVCAFARVTFASGRLTLRHDRHPVRRREAISNSIRAAYGLEAVLHSLIAPEGRYSHRHDTPLSRRGSLAEGVHGHDTPALCDISAFPESPRGGAESGFDGRGATVGRASDGAAS